MKYLLGLIVVFFSSFNFDYQQKYVCHTIIERPGLETRIIVVIKANTIQEARLKFGYWIRKKEEQIGGKEKDKSTYVVTKLKDAIMIPW